MARFRLEKEYTVIEIENEVWDFPPHNHDHFEIILVKNGTGTHTINNVTFDFHVGDVFMIAPDDYHFFRLNEYSSFIFVKFSPNIVTNYPENSNREGLVNKIEPWIYHPNIIPGRLPLGKADDEKVKMLIYQIVAEFNLSGIYSHNLILSSIQMIICIICRCLEEVYYDYRFNIKIKHKRIHEILTYIRMNIMEPENLHTDKIALSCNLTKEYLYTYFKKETGITLQKCINDYRLMIAEDQISKSDLPISQIAYNLGFADQSHFNRCFKSHFGISPGEYRKQMANEF